MTNELSQLDNNATFEKKLCSFKSADKLFCFGKKLLADKQYEKATLCFEKCFELNPTHPDNCLQLFLRSIQNEDYQRALKLYDILSNSENEFYKIEAKYYLYLLSIIIELPEKYREYARHLQFIDMTIPSEDKRYEDISSQNEIRLLSVQKKFPYALSQLKNLIAKHGSLTVQDVIVRALLFKAASEESISKNTVISLIKQKKYNEVVDYLLNKKLRHNLSLTEQYILRLSKQFIEIEESSKIPERKIEETNTMFEAINTNNYDVALKISTEYNKGNNVSNDNNAISILLDDICKLINTLKQQGNDQTDISDKKVSHEATFPLIISCLMQNDLDNAFYNLSGYMKSIGKSEFEFLIINLIKISLLENDKTFTKPMIELALMSKENYTFNISSYVQDFYVALSQSNLEKARIYLDIVSKLNKLGQGCKIVDSLYQVLESTEKVLNYNNDNSIPVQVKKIVDNSESKKVISAPIISSHPVEQSTDESLISKKAEIKIDQVKKTKQSVLTQYMETRERKFIAKKHRELVEKKGIILLDSIDESRINKILDIANEYSDMVAFIIDDEYQQRVVLRYKPKIKESVDAADIIKKGNEAYKKKNYDNNIEAYLQLLQIFKDPRPSIYSKLGLAYLRKSNIPLAIDYLTVATSLAKKENLSIDFSDLISRLNSELGNDDIKPVFKMTEEDFNYNDSNDFYDIENFEEINSYIINSGLDVESACEKMGISPERIDIIRLIYAKEFYLQGYYEKGDLFLNSVMKNKNKTKEVIKLLEEVRKNKRFYHNRQVGEPKQLSLTLTPKKINK